MIIDDYDVVKSIDLYEIRKSYDEKYYAYCNGKLLSMIGELSYNSALRKHVLPRITKDVKIYNIMVSLDYAANMINVDNIDELLSKYNYKEIIEKYGENDAIEIENLIDDWNQSKSYTNGIKRFKVNPHDIKVSKDHDVTFQELHEKLYIPFKDSDNNDSSRMVTLTHYFINGIPLTLYEKIENNFFNGIPVDEWVTIPSYSEHLEFMSEFIIDKESYIVYSDNKDFDDLYDESLEEQIKEAVKVKRLQKPFVVTE